MVDLESSGRRLFAFSLIKKTVKRERRAHPRAESFLLKEGLSEIGRIPDALGGERQLKR